MIIAQISDTHILAKSSDQPAGASRADSLRRCIADINGRTVDAVIHTGDSVQHAQPGEYAYLREILGELKAPLYLVPGNRDRHPALRAAFDDFSYLPKSGELLHYAIDEYPMRLVGLDSVSDGERKGIFDARRRAWLDETLALEPNKPTLLFIHHPPFDVAEAGYTGGYRDTEDARALTALVNRHPQVKRLLCGHVHVWHREAWGGTVATTMPSVAVDLRAGPDKTGQSEPSYILHTVSRDGDIATRTQVVSPS